VEPGDRVFPVSDVAISRAFKKLCIVAGLLTNAERSVRVPGSLRHSAISFNILSREKSVYDLALWAGTSVKMIESYYSALRPQMLMAKRRK
jgi:hypothetical protein